MLTMYGSPATLVCAVVHWIATTSPSWRVKVDVPSVTVPAWTRRKSAAAPVGRQAADRHADQRGAIEADEPARLLIHGDVTPLLVPDEHGDAVDVVGRFAEQRLLEELVRFVRHCRTKPTQQEVRPRI